MTRLSFQAVMLTTVAFGALCAGGGVAQAQFKQTDLVSDIPGLATITDPNLKNPWGLSFAPGSPIWISNQGTNTSTLYPVTGSMAVAPTPFTVNIPTTTSGPQGPTGQVANTNTAAFDVGHGGDGASADFIFANLNGSISAWDGTPLTQAFTQTSVAGASFTGLAVNQADTMLFAANDAGSGSIDVFNSSFSQISLGAAAFATPTAISAAGLVPFDVKDIGGNVFVTYAPSGHPEQTAAMAGQGALAEFSESGALENMKVGGQFASPWGLALAPMSFGKLGGDLLVANFAFGDSVINAFDPTTLAFEGSIAVNPGAGNMPGGLWSIAFGGGGNDGNPSTLFFTDGINGENDGLFGSIVAAPEASTWAMLLVGFGSLGLFAARRRRGAAIG
jgi:uncharacterized protein (TIGR03118 family)